MNIIEEVKNFVKEETYKETSKYGSEPYEFHFKIVVKYAKILAEKYNADMEIVEIASWLHDIGSIISGRKDHHITGSKIAEEKLLELNYPIDKIELVKKCILNHRGSVNSLRESIEEKIVSEADTLSTFDNISGVFKAAFIYEKLDQGQARISVREKLQRKYNQLFFEDSKKLIKPIFDAAMIITK